MLCRSRDLPAFTPCPGSANETAAVVPVSTSTSAAEIISLFTVLLFRTLGREGKFPLYTRTRAEPERSLPPPQEV
jgi:hypothetical protein